MNKRSVAIGPGSASLILMIVVVSMSILCTLALLSARGDDRLSSRSAAVTETNYLLYDRSEHTLADLSGRLFALQGKRTDEEAVRAALPEEMCYENGTVYWTESENGRILHCAVQITEKDGVPALRWTEHRVSTDGAEEEDELWD